MHKTGNFDKDLIWCQIALVNFKQSSVLTYCSMIVHEIILVDFNYVIHNSPNNYLTKVSNLDTD